MAVKRIVQAARESGYDSLGINADPESLLALARMAKKRFLAKPTEDALQTWRELLEDIASSVMAETLPADWMLIQQLELEIAAVLTGFVSGSVPQILAAEKNLQESTKREVAELLGIALANGR